METYSYLNNIRKLNDWMIDESDFFMFEFSFENAPESTAEMKNEKYEVIKHVYEREQNANRPWK